MYRLAVTLVVATLLSPLIAHAETSTELPVIDEALYSCKPRVAAVEITFKPEVELKELLAWVMGFTCKRFVLDPRIVATGRKVTLIAPGTQTPAQAYDMFITALSTVGLTVVPKGKLMQVVEAATSKGASPPLYKDKVPDASEQVVRYVMRPQYAQPDVLRQAVTLLKSDVGDVQAAGAFLIVTDRATNVRDMVAIAKLVDVPGGTDGLYTIPVHHADAQKLADKLGALLELGTAKGAAPRPDAAVTPSKLQVDERTNTLIVAGTAAAFQRVAALVARLDIALDIEGATLHVYQLGSAIADEIAKTLNDAIQAQQQTDNKTGRSLSQLEGSVRIISDKATNKLIIMASGRDFLAVREVIRELDVPRRQVYIEATILEVQTGNGTDLGVSSHTSYSTSSGSVVVGGVQAPNLKSTNLSTLTTASGLVGGLIGSTLSGSSALLGTSIPSYGVLLQALAKTSNANILSTMPILVVDNEQAKYKVGTNVPYKKGVLPTSATANTTISTNIEREPLVLELEIKPHISTDNAVLLEVKQSSKDKAEDDAELGPTWTERSVETRILVQDQQTVVLGGLLQVRDSTSETKVPILGDIPLLGHLFKYTSTEHKKMNLLILLTPYIIKDNLDLERIRARKQREYDEFAGSQRSFDGMRYQPKVDYTRKRGLVEEINRSVLDVEADTAARKALREPAAVTPGLVE